MKIIYNIAMNIIQNLMKILLGNIFRKEVDCVHPKEILDCTGIIHHFSVVSCWCIHITFAKNNVTT